MHLVRMSEQLALARLEKSKKTLKKHLSWRLGLLKTAEPQLMTRQSWFRSSLNRDHANAIKAFPLKRVSRVLDKVSRLRVCEQTPHLMDSFA